MTGAVRVVADEPIDGTLCAHRRLALEIIVTQQEEIAAMNLAVGRPLPPGPPAPDQISKERASCVY
jgi:hypothetical protein